MASDTKLFCVLFSLVLATALSAPLAAAQSGVQLPSGEDVMRAVIIFIFGDQASSGIPDYWMTYGGFMQYIVFPFIAVFVVMYGILTEIRIFHEAKVKAILALVMAFVGGFYVLTSMRWILVANGFIGTWGFGIVMGLGIVLWAMRGITEGLVGFSKPFEQLTGKQMLKSAQRRVEMAKIRQRIVQLENASVMGDASQAARAEKLLEDAKKQLEKLSEQEENPSY